jgi:hypothetical protein
LRAAIFFESQPAFSAALAVWLGLNVNETAGRYTVA